MTMKTITITSKTMYEAEKAFSKALGHQIIHDHVVVSPDVDSKGKVLGEKYSGELVIEENPNTTPLPVRRPKLEYSKLLTDGERIAFIAKHLGLME